MTTITVYLPNTKNYQIRQPYQRLLKGIPLSGYSVTLNPDTHEILASKQLLWGSNNVGHLREQIEGVPDDGEVIGGTVKYWVRCSDELWEALMGLYEKQIAMKALRDLDAKAAADKRALAEARRLLRGKGYKVVKSQ